MNPILNLYDSILVPIFEDWIDDSELCLLDSAVCSSTLRTKFLATICKCKIINTSMNRNNLNVFYEWIVLKNMKLRKINADGRDELRITPVVKKLLSKTSCFDVIRVSNGKLLSNLVARYRFNVLGCIFTKTATDEDVMTVMGCCPLLENVVLVDCSLLTENFLYRICDSYPQIKTIETPDHLNINSILKRCSLRAISGSLSNSALLFAGTFDLVKLNLTGKSISGNHMKAIIESCPCLEELVMVCFEMTDSDVENLTNKCMRIVSLTLECDLITDVGCKLLAVRYNKALTYFSLLATIITDDGVLAVAENCPALTFLALCGSERITNRAVKFIEIHCKDLESLLLDGCTRITEVRLSKIFQRCPALKSLGYQGIATSDTFLFHTAVNMERLEFYKEDEKIYSITKDLRRKKMKCSGINSINARDVFGENPLLTCVEFLELQITDDVIEALVAECPLLNTIYILDCPVLTNKLFYLLAKSTHLTQFALRGFKSLNVKDVVTLVQNKPTMQMIELPVCSGVTDAVLNAIAQYCSLLENLNVRVSDVTSEGLYKILQSCPNLHTLCIENCLNVSGDFLRHLYGRRMRKVYIEGCSIDHDEVNRYLETNPSTIIIE